MTARVVSKKFVKKKINKKKKLKKKKVWFLPSYPLYPTATAQAASSLFIAARLRTGPACLSQDPAVNPLTTASDWLTESKRGIPESRGRERSCEEKLKKKNLCILSLYDSLNWEIAWREERKKKRKEQKRREQKEARQTHTPCVRGVYQRITLSFCEHTNIMPTENKPTELSCIEVLSGVPHFPFPAIMIEQIHPMGVLCSSCIN